jgi:hypothetical protein
MQFCVKRLTGMRPTVFKMKVTLPKMRPKQPIRPKNVSRERYAFAPIKAKKGTALERKVRIVATRIAVE